MDFLVLQNACHPIAQDLKKVRCSQPTRGILDRLFFAVQYESFYGGRLTLGARLSAGKMVLRERFRDH